MRTFYTFFSILFCFKFVFGNSSRDTIHTPQSLITMAPTGCYICRECHDHYPYVQTSTPAYTSKAHDVGKCRQEKLKSGGQDSCPNTDARTELKGSSTRGCCRHFGDLPNAKTEKAAAAICPWVFFNPSGLTTLHPLPAKHPDSTRCNRAKRSGHSSQTRPS